MSLTYQVFILSSLHLLSTRHRFAAFFIESQPFNDMFIYSCKSRCCNGTFAVYTVASKECLTRMQIIFRCLESTFHQLCYLRVLLSHSFVISKFCSNWLRVRPRQENKRGCFYETPCTFLNTTVKEL